MMQVPFRTFVTLFAVALAGTASTAQNVATARGADTVLRLDGGETTYIVGVNEKGELQTIYWGGRLGK